MIDKLKNYVTIFSIVFGMTLAVYGGWKLAVEIVKIVSGVLQ